MLPDTAKFSAEYRPSLLNGVEVVTGKAVALAYDAQGQVVKHEQSLTMIPYYAWANRGRGQMAVWLPAGETAARPLPYPTVVTGATVTVSGRTQQRNVDVIADGEIPAASNDHASYFDWYPARGNKETVDYTFAKPAMVTESGLYWFDDTGQGSVRVPASWRLLYKDGDHFARGVAGATQLLRGHAEVDGEIGPAIPPVIAPWWSSWSDVRWSCSNNPSTANGFHWRAPKARGSASGRALRSPRFPC
jgi:hypothetical protein